MRLSAFAAATFAITLAFNASAKAEVFLGKPIYVIEPAELSAMSAPRAQLNADRIIGSKQLEYIRDKTCYAHIPIEIPITHCAGYTGVAYDFLEIYQEPTGSPGYAHWEMPVVYAYDPRLQTRTLMRLASMLPDAVVPPGTQEHWKFLVDSHEKAHTHGADEPEADEVGAIMFLKKYPHMRNVIEVWRDVRIVRALFLNFDPKYKFFYSFDVPAALDKVMTMQPDQIGGISEDVLREKIVYSESENGKTALRQERRVDRKTLSTIARHFFNIQDSKFESFAKNLRNQKYNRQGIAQLKGSAARFRKFVKNMSFEDARTRKMALRIQLALDRLTGHIPYPKPLKLSSFN